MNPFFKLLNEQARLKKHYKSFEKKAKDLRNDMLKILNEYGYDSEEYNEAVKQQAVLELELKRVEQLLNDCTKLVSVWKK